MIPLDTTNETKIKLSKKWKIIYPDGTIKEIINLSEFCKLNNLSDGTLHNTLTGKQDNHKGFKCERL